ncbi:hypothetical protein KSP40_PGU000646 [Platanthera guangdongensis]|uniref:Pyroglutamyl-peptidase I n=1 Tax=Platanthera guangdongensis TaxID=2320717 RepID=A0ABR2MXG9_9ASPA
MGSEGPPLMTVNVTGFKKFPGVSENPTETFISNLQRFMERRGLLKTLILGSCSVLDTAGNWRIARILFRGFIGNLSLIMWRGSGMTSMMFPNIQNYMAHMCLGIGRSPMRQLTSSPSANQMQMCPQSIKNMRFSNERHSSKTLESFSSLLGFHHMQSSTQAMSLYAYGAHVAQQNQMAVIIKNNSVPSDGFTTRGGNLQNGK